MRFKNRAFALIWILLSVVLCCGIFSFAKNMQTAAAPEVMQQAEQTQMPIDNGKLSLFLLLTTLISVSMGVFFFAYSDELNTYIGNYKRTKEI